MKLNLCDEDVASIIAALNYYAHMEAGQTQKPNLCAPTDYREHDLACDLQSRLDKSVHLRSLWVLNKRTGEKERL